MDFFTKIDTPKFPFFIDHKSKAIMFGSCFIESMGTKLQNAKFDINLNPFGILYNPASIAQAIEMLINQSEFSKNNIIEYKGLFHSLYHHGLFSNITKERCLEKINENFREAKEYIHSADLLILTIGTSYVYKHIKSGIIVGNCHKMPASEFKRYRLSVAEIVEQWKELITDLQKINPKLKIIFTISPIRHLRDGAHDNQISKSTLLLAVEELCKSEGIYYFPSYEIVLDELRDYRFYKEDMVHPNEIAISYIWERFRNAFFSPITEQIIDQWQKIDTAINHRPSNPEGNDYKRFLVQTLLKLEAFRDKYNYICCNKELQLLNERLENKKRLNNEI